MKSRFEQFKITPDLLPAGISYDNLHHQLELVDTSEIGAALEPLIPQDCGHPLIRVGGAGDGGYLLPDDLDGIEACFSPGTNNFKNFEDQLAKSHGIKSFMCDFTSDPEKLRTPLIEGLQTFEKKWLDVTPLPDNLDINQWVADNTSPSSDNILQIDIEGAEYRNLLHATVDTLSRFRIIVIELHALYLLNESSFLRGIFEPIMRKLARQFTCCHVHGNNCCGTTDFGDGWNVPRVLELTFLRNDRVRASDAKLLIPNPMDDLNMRRNPPIHMDGPWLRNADPVASEMVHLRRSTNWMQDQIIESKKTEKRLQIQLNGCATRLQSQLKRRFKKLDNIALGKEASQSSLSKHSTAEGAGGANNGIKTGRYGIHTQIEKNPWWMVDLKQLFELHGILIYNRLDSSSERSDTLRVKISADGENWTRIYRHNGKPTFGGYISVNCAVPLVVNIRSKQARYVRIECSGRTCLHLDEIEIYGQSPADAAPSASGKARRKAKKMGK
jgi:hypothetical protein